MTRLGRAGQDMGFTNAREGVLMNLFEPKNDMPLWEMMYNLAERYEPGQLIPYSVISETLGYDITLPGASRAPIYKASQRLLTSKCRTLKAKPREGYRVAEASEHENLARDRQGRARRQISKGVSIAANVDKNALTPAQRTSIDALCQVLSAQNAMLRRHDARIGDVEKSMRVVDDRVTVMEQLLRRNGIPVPNTTVIGADGEE